MVQSEAVYWQEKKNDLSSYTVSESWKEHSIQCTVCIFFLVLRRIVLFLKERRQDLNIRFIKT